jgi:hypothetical protein
MREVRIVGRPILCWHLFRFSRKYEGAGGNERELKNFCVGSRNRGFCRRMWGNLKRGDQAMKRGLKGRCHVFHSLSLSCVKNSRRKMEISSHFYALLFPAVWQEKNKFSLQRIGLKLRQPRCSWKAFQLQNKWHQACPLWVLSTMWQGRIWKTTRCSVRGGK